MYKNWSRLQPVLKFRKSVEDELTLKLADIKRKFRSSEDELIDLQNRAISLKSGFLKDGKVDAASVAVHGQYLDALSYEASSIEAKLSELEVEMGETHGKLIQASKARKMIKTIIDKGQVAQKESERTSEIKVLDEVGIARYLIRRTDEKDA